MSPTCFRSCGLFSRFSVYTAFFCGTSCIMQLYEHFLQFCIRLSFIASRIDACLNLQLPVNGNISMSCVYFLFELNITRVGTLIVATIYLQLIQNRYMFRSFTVLQCSHQHCVKHVASDVEVVGYL